MPLTPASRLSIEALGAKFNADFAHARQVADLALGLFDATHVAFGIPESDRAPLEAACLLHDVAWSADPRRHAEIAAAAVLRLPLPGFDAGRIRLIATLIRLHPASVDLDSARAAARRLPDPRRALFSAALIRIADALDFSHLQDVSLQAARTGKHQVRIDLRGGHFPQGVEMARRRATLWREVFPVGLDLRLARNGARKELVAESMPFLEAARRLMSLHCCTMLANVEGAMAGGAKEPLHDLRIAIRQMRTVLRLLRKLPDLPSAERIDRDLQRLNRTLGLARDLDVWIGFFSDEAVSRQYRGHRLWARFVAHQLELRRMQEATVRRQLGGARFRALRTRIERFLRIELPAAEAQASPAPVAAIARRSLAKHLRSALELGHLRRSRVPDKLHRLRIALRRVRYLGGFFEPALGRPVKRLRRRAHAVERILGQMRDADIALSRIREEGPAPPRLLVRQLEQVRRKEAAGLERAWSRLTEPRFIAELNRQLKPPAS